MIIIKMKIPRHQISHVYYTGEAEKFINLPIVINGNAVGVITKVADSDEEYHIDIEGYLWMAGASYLQDGNELIPVDITIK